MNGSRFRSVGQKSLQENPAYKTLLNLYKCTDNRQLTAENIANWEFYPQLWIKITNWGLGIFVGLFLPGFGYTQFQIC